MNADKLQLVNNIHYFCTIWLYLSNINKKKLDLNSFLILFCSQIKQMELKFRLYSKTNVPAVPIQQ